MSNSQKLITVLEKNILRHICHSVPDNQTETKLKKVPADPKKLPTWSPDSFYLTNIGSEKKPLFLELRFEPASDDLWIALLMTNERTPRDLGAMGRRLNEKLEARGIDYTAPIGIETLGSNLSQEMARLKGPKTLLTSFQKGKPRLEDGKLILGPPKKWVGLNDSVMVRSGTGGKAPQALFMDPKIAKTLKDKPVVIVDDARLTSGTMDASIELARKMGLNVAAVATVLNEADQTDQLHGIPYVSLTKVPVFNRGERGLEPIPGSFDGVNNFYLEGEYR
jgi:hypothetical protein